MMDGSLTRGLRAAKHRQGGQALVETAILAVIIVPLFILISMLAKYAHLRHAGQEAARAAAWEATVTPEHDWSRWDADRAQQMQRLIDRHLGAADAPIRTEPSGVAADAAVANPFMNTFSNRPLIRRNDVELRPYTRATPQAISSVLGSVTNLLENLPGEFPPNRNGLVTTELVVRPQNLQTRNGGAARFLRPFDSIDLEFTSTHVLLADSWGASGNGLAGSPSASSSRSVYQQTCTLVLPCSLGDLAEIGEFLEDLEVLGEVPFIGVPFRMRPGYMQPDIVPGERLRDYNGP